MSVFNVSRSDPFVCLELLDDVFFFFIFTRFFFQDSPRLIQHHFLHLNRTSIEFLCEFCSNPPSEIHWMKTNQILSQNKQIDIQRDMKSHQCLITKLFLRVNSFEENDWLVCFFLLVQGFFQWKIRSIWMSSREFSRSSFSSFWFFS